MPCDVLVVGAGAAGLAAATKLARSRLAVEILEARNRVGGRMANELDPELHRRIELGAEFVHGKASEIWLPLKRIGVPMLEVAGDLWSSAGGRLSPASQFAEADEILSAIDDRQPDEPFARFVARRFPGRKFREARQWATGYVSGFNAADPALVSVHWLAHSRRADREIEGDRTFRIQGGYHRLVEAFTGNLAALGVPIHLGTVVHRIAWSAGSSLIAARTVDGDRTFSARFALVTLPLAVLQAADAVGFEPALPQEKRAALNHLVMGRAVRVTLCFRDRFWQSLRPKQQAKTLSRLSFLFSNDAVFPTWWTPMPEPLPVITGWAAAQCADRLDGLSAQEVIDRAQESLGSLLELEPSRIKAQFRRAYFHDWTQDRFARGAYSYVKAGGEGSQQALAAPVEDTLFFAGEASDTAGHNGTVHGAIASGQRAAQEILLRCGRQPL